MCLPPGLHNVRFITRKQIGAPIGSHAASSGGIPPAPWDDRTGATRSLL